VIAYNLGNLWRRLILPQENPELVLDEPPAEAAEDGRTTGETRPALLAAPGREPFDETFICQHAGADSWAVSSVGIA
jgi:hypothetical protein